MSFSASFPTVFAKTIGLHPFTLYPYTDSNVRMTLVWLRVHRELGQKP